MGYLSRCYSKGSFLFKTCLKHTRSATSLAHSKGSIPKEADKESTIDIKIDRKTISKLERISLVDFDNEGGIQRLEAAIRFAQKLREVRLDPSVKPMYSVLENERLYLREDKVTEGNCREQILKNAKLLEDEYFVAPPGNIPKKS